jgi:apolipoprotein N-acyltransferase
MKYLKKHPLLFLLIGSLLNVLSHYRWGIGFLAFFAPIPFILYLKSTNGIKPKLLFLFIYFLSNTLAIFKIASSPHLLFLAPMFSLPMSIIFGLGYLIYDCFSIKLKSPLTFLIFPSILTIFEWCIHVFTPFGTWGIMANTQIYNLKLLQFASVFGAAGVSFIVYWVAAYLACFISCKDKRKYKIHGVILLSVFILINMWGSLRLSLKPTFKEYRVKVAAVGTTSKVGTSKILPTLEIENKVKSKLFQDTNIAAKNGAKLVSWTEASTLVYPKFEKHWTLKLKKLAKSNKIHLVVSYIVPTSLKPLRYENKYVWVLPNGEIDHIYFKHNPVPSEPAKRGKKPFKKVNSKFGRMSGAICYDFDFPRLGLKLGDLGIDLAIVPSSDWRGIAPFHTYMASLRAIENGYSLLRPTRFGLSAGFNQYGEKINSLSYFDSKTRVLIVELPVKKITTIYSIIGDSFIAFLLLFIILFSIKYRNEFKSCK